MSAKCLQEKAVASNTAESGQQYQDALGELLHASNAEPAEILCMEGVFRRGISGFGPIEQMVHALIGLDTEIRCHIDAFAFAFLRSAKNYDAFMRVDPTSLDSLRKQLSLWDEAVLALTEFERLGQPLPPEWAHLQQPYLALRSIIGRDSTRDERRTLVLLLVTGPATADQIRDDLRLNHSLSRRVMGALVETGALSYRQESAQYLLELETIPVVLFLVRELMGLDMLGMLDAIEAARHG
jgi:hypothetical protein